VSQNLDELTTSLDKTGGIERAMDYLFFQMTAINGFDGISHYLRAGLITNLCSSYSIEPVPGCSANFTETRNVPPSGAAAKRDPSLVALRQALASWVRLTDGNGKPVGEPGATTSPSAASPAEAARQLNDPEVARRRQAALENIRRGAAGGASPYFNQSPPSPDEAALDYLLGNDG
jgi:hypothetical protein